MEFKTTSGASGNASAIIRPASIIEMKPPAFSFDVVCRDENGNIVWTDTAHNSVTSVGCIDLLDKYFNNAASTGWYLGLISATPTPAIGDTLATHAGWTEVTNYAGTRQLITWAAASGTTPVTKVATGSSDFTMNATVTVGGLMIASVTSGTTGVLYSSAAFTSGNKATQNTYVLQVTPTVSQTPA